MGYPGPTTCGVGAPGSAPSRRDPRSAALVDLLEFGQGVFSRLDGLYRRSCLSPGNASAFCCLQVLPPPRGWAGIRPTCTPSDLPFSARAVFPSHASGLNGSFFLQRCTLLQATTARGFTSDSACGYSCRCLRVLLDWWMSWDGVPIAGLGTVGQTMVRQVMWAPGAAEGPVIPGLDR